MIGSQTAALIDTAQPVALDRLLFHARRAHPGISPEQGNVRSAQRLGAIAAAALILALSGCVSSSRSVPKLSGETSAMAKSSISVPISPVGTTLVARGTEPAVSPAPTSREPTSAVLSTPRSIDLALDSGPTVTASRIPAAHFVNCPSSSFSLHTQLPAITLDVPLLLDLYVDVTYGPVNLAWTQVKDGSGADCSLQSDPGSLPIFVNLPIHGLIDPTFIGTSRAIATLDMGIKAPPSLRRCDWAQVFTSCALNTPPTSNADGQDLVVRWHTAGFDERLAGAVSVIDTGPLTYYVFVDTSVPAGFNDVTRALQPIELFIHEALLPHVTQLALH
jgi:hypothetical protein